MKIRGGFPMARQTSHVIVPKDTPGPPEAGPAPQPGGQRRARRRAKSRRQPQLLSAGEIRGRRGPARDRGQIHPRGQGQPQGLLRPHQGRRGVSAQPAYRSLFPRQHRQPRRHPHPQAAAAPRTRFASYSPRRRSRATRSSPPGFTSATGGSSANWPWPRASRTGTSARRSGAARPTAMPAPPSTPASTAWGADSGRNPKIPVEEQ